MGVGLVVDQLCADVVPHLMTRLIMKVYVEHGNTLTLYYRSGQSHKRVSGEL